jgi:hypothetical protein
MMKEDAWVTVVKFVLTLCVLLWIVFLIYNYVGWFDGDMDAYLKEQYQPEGKQIVSSEYELMGGTGLDGFMIYRAETEDGSVYHVCIDLKYKMSLQIGTRYKVRGFRVVNPADYDLE